MENDQPDAQPETPIGQCIADHKLRQQVGVGPSGTVYSAIHTLHGDKVAVKLLHPYLTDSVELRQPLLVALQRVARLKHPGVLPLIEVGQDERWGVFVVSEFGQGQPLLDLLCSLAPLSVEEVRPLLVQLADCLALAHAQGVVHGNLTPSNIWLIPREDGCWPPHVRLSDFSLDLLHCRPSAGEREGPASALAEERPPYYLAPEQCRKEAAGIATDMYSLGVIAFQMLTGRLPFSSVRPAEVLQMHLQKAPPAPSTFVELPAEVERLVLQALAKDPADRLPSMQSFLDQLERIELTPRARAEEPLATAVSSGDAERPVAKLVQLGQRKIRLPQYEHDVHGEAVPMLVEPHSRARRVASGPIHPVTTGVLPTVKMQKPLLTPVRSAVLAVITAMVVMGGGYRLVTGQWPFSQSHAPPALEGRIILETRPPGATVHLDDVRQQGATPLTLEGLRRGQRYTLSIIQSGYLPWRQIVALGLDESSRVIQVTLPRQELRFGTLQLGANVRADFFLDTRKVGAQSRQVTLADVQAGIKHQLRVVAPGFQAEEQQVEVEAGKIRVLEFELLAEKDAGKNTAR